MSNSETESIAITYVMELERRQGREPKDVHFSGFPYDIDSPPRKIEVKAFGGPARGAAIPLEDRQVGAAREDPESFYLYIVDNVARASDGLMCVRVIYGKSLAALLDRCKPRLTYWPTLRVAEYDQAEQLAP